MFHDSFVDPNENDSEQALERGYQVDFCEPDTSWKLDPYELQR